MRKLFIVIFFLSFLNCEKNPSSHSEKFFDPQKLSLLELRDIGDFWADNSIKYVSDYMGAHFENHPGFLGGISYRGDKKGVGVSVFKSQAIAIEAMELRRYNVAALIEPGNATDFFAGKWWFSENIPNIVFVNQWNTIAEVYYYHTDYQEVKTLLMETAAEIARRIDSFSK